MYFSARMKNLLPSELGHVIWGTAKTHRSVGLFRFTTLGATKEMFCERGKCTLSHADSDYNRPDSVSFIRRWKVQ